MVFPRSQVSLLDHIAALCAQAGFGLEIAQEAVQFPTILGLVASNTGIAIVPESLQVLQLPGLTYLQLSDATAVSVVSIVSTGRSEATRPSSTISSACARRRSTRHEGPYPSCRRR